MGRFAGSVVANLTRCAANDRYLPSTSTWTRLGGQPAVGSLRLGLTIELGI